MRENRASKVTGETGLAEGRGSFWLKKSGCEPPAFMAQPGKRGASQRGDGWFPQAPDGTDCCVPPRKRLHYLTQVPVVEDYLQQAGEGRIRALPPRRRLACEWLYFVAQNYILLYRRVALCGMQEFSTRVEPANALPTTSRRYRRYSRLKICATSATGLHCFKGSPTRCARRSERLN